ncbi:hypothetical protein FACS1894121_1700 [Bacteroidia bacterium]|nr:hypothetical protein FACS1894121_1700 [Bacteroidia bacterium]GHV69943.1 hypothetical protein FACS1894199_19250 [Bacteroidia bacterium]
MNKPNITTTVGAGSARPAAANNWNREPNIEKWIDNQNVMLALHISPRQLFTLRTNGTIPYTRLENKIYYRERDITDILNDNYIMQKIQKP